MKEERFWWRRLGPGFVTGAADDDPSGIATYTQAGAQFGTQVLWLALFLLPLQMVVQETCARVGAVTGRGIAANIRKYYPSWVLYITVSLLILANTINIGADIGAMAAALQLVAPINFSFWLLIIFAAILITEIFVGYRTYAKILKWLAVTIIVYPLTLAIATKGELINLLTATIKPGGELSADYWFVALGVAGTTISPYLFFWQAAEEIEEEKRARIWHSGRPKISKKFIGNLRIDNMIGMIGSAVTAWSIMALATTIFFPQGIHEIATAAEAAKAIEPLVVHFPNAGYLAKVLFAGGIISLGFLAVPILSGSAAYAVAEAWNMREGLNLKFKSAHGFYGVITISTLVGLVINYIGIDPMKALIYTAVVNGIVAVPLLFIIGKIAGDKKIMGDWQSGFLPRIFLNITIMVMGVGAVLMLSNL